MTVALFKDILASIAEKKILEAIQQGEFDYLPGKGEPLPKDTSADVPPDLRAGYKILKNAGVLPVEMQLQEEIAFLKKILSEARSEDEKQRLSKGIREKEMYVQWMLERSRRR